MMVVLRRLWIQVTSDRKRFGVLCVMVLVGMLLWGRIIVTSNLPRTAIAAPPGNSSPPPQPVNDPPDKRERGVVRVELPSSPARDPFLISNEAFPKPTPVELLTQDDPKFPGQATENQLQAEARRTEVLRVLVGGFRLEAVMLGQPMAVINGKAYRIYSWITAVDNEEIRFQLVEVGDRSVVLECEGRRFRLRMEFPGVEER